MAANSIKCCVLGATGFIGGQIARAAVARGWEVRAVRRRPEATGAIADLDVEWALADLHDPRSLQQAMRGCQVVFHAAAYYPGRGGGPREAVREAVTGMRNVLGAVERAGSPRLVYTGAFTTVGPSGDPSRLADERDLYVPGSVPTRYFEAKWAMESEAMRAAAEGLKVVTLLPTAVFGPGDVKPATGALILMVAKRMMPGYPEAVLNAVDVRDVAAAHIAAAERGQPGKRYIAGGHNLSVRDLLTATASAAGVRPPRFRLPLWLVIVMGRAGSRLGIPGADHLAAARQWQPLESDSARRLLGLPGPTPFDRTCRDAVEWFRDNGYL
jgi:dihydroflavonol-4-reductase